MYVLTPDFGNESGNVWEVRPVGEGRQSGMANDSINFCLSKALGFGVD